jgi:23S rRNA A2030 N6-methylase RlmJ
METKNLKKQDRKFTMEVHQAEYELLKRIREKYRFGKVIIETKDGLPWRITQEIKYDLVWPG